MKWILLIYISVMFFYSSNSVFVQGGSRDNLFFFSFVAHFCDDGQYESAKSEKKHFASANVKYRTDNDAKILSTIHSPNTPQSSSLSFGFSNLFYTSKCFTKSRNVLNWLNFSYLICTHRAVRRALDSITLVHPLPHSHRVDDHVRVELNVHTHTAWEQWLLQRKYVLHDRIQCTNKT